MRKLATSTSTQLDVTKNTKLQVDVRSHARRVATFPMTVTCLSHRLDVSARTKTLSATLD